MVVIIEGHKNNQLPDGLRDCGELTLFDDINQLIDVDKCSTDVLAFFDGKEYQISDNYIYLNRS